MVLPFLFISSVIIGTRIISRSKRGATRLAVISSILELPGSVLIDTINLPEMSCYQGSLISTEW